MAKKTIVSEPNFKHTSRKVTKKNAESMKKMVARGYSLSAIAEKYGVSSYAVKYNTNDTFRASEIKRCK